MQIETIDAIHGHAMFTTAAYEDAPKLYQALWEKLQGVSIENPLVVFQCFDSPSQLSNPTHEYVCLIGQHSALKPIGGVKQHTIPGGKALTLIHKGAYNQVSAAYYALASEVKVQNLKVRAAPFEIYLNDPAEVKEEEQLTKMCFPIE
ncbi:Transcription_activator effector binding [Hexamita inflata]|uniref:Transcription activator effector binding n=1 Tax=Hexamita inflata TaxID=28002 RepID=A0AA86P0Q9_9EUKA|nr:Transcription activator effector binding [Hexamita inflata]